MLHWGIGRGIVRSGAGLSLADKFIGAMVPAPDEARKTVIRAFFTSMASILSKFDQFYLLAAHDKQGAKLNLCDPNFAPMVEVNSPVFVIDRGFTGDAATSYLQATGVNVTTLTNFKQDSATMFGWSRTDATSGNADFGTIGVAAGTSYMIIRNASNGMVSRLNSNTTGTAASNTGGIGLFGIVRNNSADYQHYKNNAVFGAVSASVTLVPAAQAFGLCRGQALFSIRQFAAGGVGAGLTLGEWTTLYNSLNTYLTAVGAAP